jgi:hypothetical protein
VRAVDVVVTETVVHDVAADVLYWRLYEVAPLTAVQLTVAPVVLIADEASPVATPQVVVVVSGCIPIRAASLALKVYPPTLRLLTLK